MHHRASDDVGAKPCGACWLIEIAIALSVVAPSE
jgi:hypothetical protein